MGESRGKKTVWYVYWQRWDGRVVRRSRGVCFENKDAAWEHARDLPGFFPRSEGSAKVDEMTVWDRVPRRVSVAVVTQPTAGYLCERQVPTVHHAEILESNSEEWEWAQALTTPEVTEYENVLRVRALDGDAAWETFVRAAEERGVAWYDRERDEVRNPPQGRARFVRR